MSKEGVTAHAAPAGMPRRRPDPRAQRTSRKVLDAALTELRHTRYGDMTMRTVATRAGVSVTSAYRYFPSKNALAASLYLDLLQNAPVHVDVNDTTKARIIATMRDMALVGADEPELITACATALMADDPAVTAIRSTISQDVSRRIGLALGPGWPPSVRSTLAMAFAGALMTARFVAYEEITALLDNAVSIILACPPERTSY